METEIDLTPKGIPATGPRYIYSSGQYVKWSFYCHYVNCL